MNTLVLNSPTSNVLKLVSGPQVLLRDERVSDIEAREALLDRCFGDDRFARTSERLREGRVPTRGLALIAEVDGEVVGSVRLWEIMAGDRPALLLGPLAVAPETQGSGIGKRLMREALWRAAIHGHEAVLLVGDAPYYARFGFSAAYTTGLDLPGPVDRARFLGLELRDGALRGASGMVAAGRRHDVPMNPAPVTYRAAEDRRAA
jgi:predicted N-acetyltransferase YhbS